MTTAPIALRQRTIDANRKTLPVTKALFDLLVSHRMGFVKVNAPLYEKQESGQWACVGCTCSLAADCPPKNRGKHPVGEGWQKHPTTEWDVAERWLLAGYSLGLYPLPGCRVIGLDEDDAGALDELFGSVSEDTPFLTTIGDSMRGKFHLFLLVPDDYDIETVTTGKFKGGDVLRDGLVRHFVAPNMLHPEGRRAWNGVSTLQTASPALLNAMIAAVEAEKAAIRDARLPSDPGWEVKEGARHGFLLSSAAHLRNAGLDEDGIYAALARVNEQRCIPPKTDAEIRKIARDYSKKESVAEQPRITLTVGGRDINDLARSSSNGNGHTAPTDENGEPVALPALKTLARYSPRRVNWLWDGWMPRAEPVILEGLGGEGKSTFVVDLMSRLTRGDVMPDGAPNPFGRPMNCVYITGEDDPERILLPRFMAARGVVTRIHFWSRSFLMPKDMQALIDEVTPISDLAVIFIDPLFSHLDPKINPNADVEIRQQVMDPLRQIARALDTTILIARHLNKKSGDEIGLRGSGSYGGLTGAARSVIHSMTDPDDDTKQTKVVGVIKANYGRMPLPWRFQIVDEVVVDEDGEEIKTSCIAWVERCDKHLDAIAARAASKAGNTGAASRWQDTRNAADAAILDILSSGELLRDEVVGEMGRRGFGRNAAYDAADRCRVEKVRPGGNTGPYVWRLPGQKPGRQGHFDLP
jgi:hypothetical protein